MATALPIDWRDRLPDAASYYIQALGHLMLLSSADRALARCPFHRDLGSRLVVRLRGRGAWRCLTCSAHGDIIEFHMRRTGLRFVDAVLALIAGPPRDS